MKRWIALTLLPASAAAAAPSIAPGALDQVLHAYMSASGALLSAEARLLAGRTSGGLAAVTAPDQDLPHILAGTGLEALRQSNGSYILRLAAPSAAAAPHATTPPAEPRSEAELAALQRLPEVVAQAEPPSATASGFALKGGGALRDIPQAISIVSADQIRDRNLLSMADLLEYVPGVQASQGEGNRDNAVFRGYNSSADFYLNGMRDDVQYFRDFYNIDAVEVLKGPNAMLLGRGGSGGAINRVTKQAQWRPLAEADLLLGSWQQRRATIDVGDAINPQWAWRLNAVDESADSFRDGVWLKRHGVSPALAWRDGAGTLVQLNYEHFRDHRTTDRGVPSYNGRPVATDPSTFFGDPSNSYNYVNIDALTLRLERQLAPGLQFTSQLHGARYDKYYQNVFAGGMTDSDTVRILGYGSATLRSNLFYQAELAYTLHAGGVQHQLNAGLDAGRQRTDNARTTGYFDSLGTDVRLVSVSLGDPTFSLPISFRASATDAANASTATNLSLYLQDQITLSPAWQLLVGLRAETLDVAFRDIRNGLQLASHDHPVSPRLGLLYRPQEAWTLYASYSQAYAPRVGEQLSSLTVSTQDLAPEVVRNTEIGAKWSHGDSGSASLALYQLRRSNVLLADPLIAGQNELVEGQRGQGVELELTARPTPSWQLSAGYAWQRSWLTSTQSSSAKEGAQMPYVPRQTLSLWSTHTLQPGLEASLGLVARSSSFSSTSNLVQLPGYGRLDATLSWQATPTLRLQLAVDNLLNRQYYASAYNDNNISPGAPRTLRLRLHTRF
ncbi:TonB-dependent siderophore receptor [Duganella sp. FT80W]|uniref:TonB-dependent siderophore receptor n=1 Tax=Duganella guangzhouensis TaxID=2666084 RepID=A0A6I2L4D7_9BURK|nr:TonB-dependent siderophore receptor [Duganella guangzhouensis]MRW92027.1 TonB-dependent siderophore receptor [Duganella guangzhouensis]